MTATSVSLLRRFVIAGLRDTLDCYIAGTLPLHRFAWELDSRLTALAELTDLPDWRALALRTAQRAIAAVDADLRATGRADLAAGERHAVGVAVTTLRATLARLDPPGVSASTSTGTSPVPVEPTHPRPVVVPLPNRISRVRAGAATGQRASRNNRQRFPGPECEAIRAESPR
jgi:hypothetical protein